MEEQKTTEITSCKGSVMSRIHGGEVCPRSKTFFQTRECAVWALWGLSVIIGALSVAVTIFVLSYRQYGLYEATHDNFFTFMVDVLPMLWFVVFGLMVFVGFYNLRHTKHGYRYPMWQIVGSSVVLSLAAGAALQLFGLGYSTDHMLGARMGMYNSQDKIEKRLWQNPAEGRLIGTQTAPFLLPARSVEFTDVEGAVWQVDVVDLSDTELNLLNQTKPVRIIGVWEDKKTNAFHSCGVFPWQIDKSVSREDLLAAREAFKMKVNGYGERAEHAMLALEGKSENEDLEATPCAEIEPVHRFDK